MIFDVSSAMSYLHRYKPTVVHGDLKCQNILIGHDFHAKICDFGLSRILHTVSKSQTNQSVCGTLEYIAPEYFRQPRKTKTQKFDVYSFAISAWEIFHEKSAYHDFCDRRIIPVCVERGERPTMEANDATVPIPVGKIVQECWHQNEGERPAFSCIRASLLSLISGMQELIEKSLTSLLEQRCQQQQSVNALTQASKELLFEIVLLNFID